MVKYLRYRRIHCACTAIHGLQSWAIDRLMAGGRNEESNGNGSLMRIQPLILFYIKGMPVQQQFHHVEEVSSITHGAYTFSISSCFIYIEFAWLFSENG